MTDTDEWTPEHGSEPTRVVDAVRTTAEDVSTMEVRGAAAIADAAAAALAAQAEASDAETADGFLAELETAAHVLHETRPTAVSLANALRRVLLDLSDEGDTVGELRRATVERATSVRRDVDAAQERLGRVGANRLRDGDTIMTHCHSTDALACVEAAVETGKEITAYVKETRPRNQGHITAGDLDAMGVPVTLIVDGAARRYLDETDHVLVGADSIAADGGVVNKIGTSGLAVIARERGVPITVAASTIKLHPGTLTGEVVPIETRDETELLDDNGRAAIGDIEVANPAFDVTPPRYLDAIVTERGQFPPESIVVLIRELYGDSTGEPWTP
ncbi:ribose 1,5-bisphosphate isomerase [Halobacteriales archaeon SW_7_68_16]|nr:MAG: ribose 1,5-bisphosphate isomerase [Halobacteriales archaeon SW_7_68_16]